MIATLIQVNCVWENPTETFKRVESLLASQPVAPGGLLVLPELFATGFTMEPQAARQSGEITKAFCLELAKKAQCCVLAGVAGERNGYLHNQAIAWAPDGAILTTYTKQRPFSLAQEGTCYFGGHNATIFEWQGFRIAPLICYDLRFPELFREAMTLGVDCFAVIASWPIKRDRHWITLLQARAIENQSYVLGCNRCGSDPQFTYSGRSLAVDPQGIVIADASSAETTVSARLNLASVRSWREEFPALRDAGIKP